MRSKVLACTCFLLLCAGLAWAQGDLVTGGALEARLDAASTSGAAVITFSKPTAERYFVGLELKPALPPLDTLAYEARFELHLAKGQRARAACFLWLENGVVWRNLLPRSLPETGETLARFDVHSFQPAPFSALTSAPLQLTHLRKLWIGAAIEGKGSGKLVLSHFGFTSKPFTRTTPHSLFSTAPEEWHLARDTAARGKLTFVKTGPGGLEALRLDFSFPGGRHMYVLPTLHLPPGVEWDGYRALRLRYRAKLPPGISTLLVLLQEANGAQYVADELPPASADWRTFDLPLKAFHLGEWSHDPDNKLDLYQVNRITIGLHGTASTSLATGWIEVAGLRLVP